MFVPTSKYKFPGRSALAKTALSCSEFHKSTKVSEAAPERTLNLSCCWPLMKPVQRPVIPQEAELARFVTKREQDRAQAYQLRQDSAHLERVTIKMSGRSAAW